MSGKHGLLWGAVALAVVTALCGCQPKTRQNEAAVSSQVTDGPAYQHRTFDTGDTQQVLRGVIAILQDMDFIVDTMDASQEAPTILASTVNAGGITTLRVMVRKAPERTVVRVIAGSQGKMVKNLEYYQPIFDALSRTLSLPARTDEDENAAASAPAAPPTSAPAPAPTSAPDATPATPVPASDIAPAATSTSAPDSVPVVPAPAATQP